MSPATIQNLAPQVKWGNSPLLVSVPHAGTGLTPGMLPALTEAASSLPDTDWFVDQLIEFAGDLSASLLVARASRWVCDLNRPCDDQPLYDATQTNLITGVLPRQCFSGEAIYRPGCEPDQAESQQRLADFWQPYHRMLQQGLERIREKHGFAILLDAHSIRSEVPLLFNGTLPDLNLGSNGGVSASPQLLQIAETVLRESDFSVVVDGRFKGGYITRHYGRPNEHLHALQLEISQRAYMQEQPPCWIEDKAKPLQIHLNKLFRALASWKPAHD